MPNLPRVRHLVPALALILAASLAGGLLAQRSQADTRSGDDRLRVLGHILALVEDEYVGEVDSNTLVENAIRGMLRTLDPHSNYVDPETFREMRDEQRGQFEGLGIQINKPAADRPITIVAPIEETPAWRAGLRPGDVIFKIEGEETAEMSLAEAVRRLKGPKGTAVTITIHRPSEGRFFDVTIVRDTVPTHSIRVAYLLGTDVGLIKISNFTSTTAQELDAAVRKLREQGMKKLLLDLRSNPGGLLDQAVKVSQRFLEPGQLVVFTRGRVPGSDEDYVARRGGLRVDEPLVILVDRNSASASEIVSGAVQDHDRGLLVGETTFGKGLVQRVMPLRNGGALALTTAKYYTPSGRLIQRDYTDLDEYFLHDEEDGNPPPTAGEDEGEDADRQIFYTDSGRKVYGGGGITPDYKVPSKEFSALMSRLIRQNLLFDFAVLYAQRHPQIEKDVPMGDEDLAAFQAFLAEREADVDPVELQKESADVLLRLRSLVAKVQWGDIEESRILAEADPQVQKARSLFEEAAELARNAREIRKKKMRDAAALRADAPNSVEPSRVSSGAPR